MTQENLIIKVMAEWMKENNYDRFVEEAKDEQEFGCSCTIDNLFPCTAYNKDCVPIKKDTSVESSEQIRCQEIYKQSQDLAMEFAYWVGGIRDIYRAKSLRTEKWIVGYYWQDGSGAHYIIRVGDVNIEDIRIDPKTLGRCTGLEDIEGNKIFYNNQKIQFLYIANPVLPPTIPDIKTLKEQEDE